MAKLIIGLFKIVYIEDKKNKLFIRGFKKLFIYEPDVYKRQV